MLISKIAVANKLANVIQTSQSYSIFPNAVFNAKDAIATCDLSACIVTDEK